MAGLLTSGKPLTGTTKLADWMDGHADRLGRRYVSELRRNWRHQNKQVEGLLSIVFVHFTRLKPLVPSGRTLLGRLLCGAPLSSNTNLLEWTQIGLPRALGFCVSILTVKRRFSILSSLVG